MSNQPPTMNIYELVFPKRCRIVGFKHAALKALGTDQMPHIPFKKPMVKSLLSVRAGFPGVWIVSTPDTPWIPTHSERRSRTGTFSTCTCSSQHGSGRSNAPSLRGMLVAIDLEIFRSKQLQETPTCRD